MVAVYCLLVARLWGEMDASTSARTEGKGGLTLRGVVRYIYGPGGGGPVTVSALRLFDAANPK